MCIADPPVPRSIISTNIVRVVLDETQLTPEYFVTLFTTFPDRLARLKSNKKDNAFTFLNPGTLKAIEIPFPPPDRQLAFRTKIDALEAHRALHDCGALRADEMFSSLSQRAFRGEL
jgi:type I restriction enzyme S subunit